MTDLFQEWIESGDDSLFSEWMERRTMRTGLPTIMPNRFLPLSQHGIYITEDSGCEITGNVILDVRSSI